MPEIKCQTITPIHYKIDLLKKNFNKIRFVKMDVARKSKNVSHVAKYCQVFRNVIQNDDFVSYDLFVFF